MSEDEGPTFDPRAIVWAHTVLFQALITQLIESRAISVAEAQRVFDIALQRASRESLQAPDAEKLIQHVHDNLRWDDLYRQAAEQNKDPSEDR